MPNANYIFVPQMARVWLAPVGTIAPAGPTTVMPVGWKDCGLFTPDSLAWSTDPSFEQIRSHQSRYPTRNIQTEDAAAVAVDLQEWSAANMMAVYGGGTITTVPAVVGPPAVPLYYRFAPPAIGTRQTVACIIEMIDGTRAWRRVVPRCEQNEGVEQNLEATSESTLPLRLSVLGSDVGDPWYDITNDPAMAPAA